MDISAWCPDYMADPMVRVQEQMLKQNIDIEVRKRAGLKGRDSFKIRRNAQLYITSIQSFGAGIGHLQDADCEVEGNGCCATATCKLKFSAIDRYSDPLDLCQRWGICGGAQNVGGTVFWFGLGCNSSYSSTACK
jgi:hypothetical protein